MKFISFRKLNIDLYKTKILDSCCKLLGQKWQESHQTRVLAKYFYFYYPVGYETQ